MNFLNLFNIDLSFLSLLQRQFSITETFNFALTGVLIYLAIFWLALIIWVTRDIINRTNNILFQSFAILLNTFFPVFGLIIYLLIRPSKTLMDKYYDEMEIKSLNLGKFCSACSAPLSEEFGFCPECGNSLKNICDYCHKDSFKEYKICPFCGEKKEKIEVKNKKNKAESVKEIKETKKEKHHENKISTENLSEESQSDKEE